MIIDSADYWFKQDDDLRYVSRVLGSEATPEDRAAAKAIIHRLRTEVRHMGQALAAPAERPNAVHEPEPESTAGSTKTNGRES